MKYDIRTFSKFEMYLWPGVGQLSQVKSVNCVKNFSIANKSIMRQRIKYDKLHSLYVYTHRSISSLYYAKMAFGGS